MKKIGIIIMMLGVFCVLALEALECIRDNRSISPELAFRLHLLGIGGAYFCFVCGGIIIYLGR